MKILFLSDTHSQIKNIWECWSEEDKQDSLNCDLVIHCGDITSQGTRSELESELKNFNNIFHQEKIMIAGNHDFFLDTNWKYYTEMGRRRHSMKLFGSTKDIEEIMNSYKIIYLNDSGIDISGIKIWGSPITPWFHDWAFNRERGNDIRDHWNKIPEKLDILITHGPPKGILDMLKYPRLGESPNAGCGDLLESVFDKRPKIHAFGHIHESNGYFESNDIKFINASCLSESYIPIKKPHIVNI